MTITMNSSSGPIDASFDHLRTSKSSSRINLIENIRANGVGELVALPQLVVCGDQSAGKSSVLEGITRIPFPRQDGLCTRFPTEIILRHVSTTEPITITATIRPHASRSDELRKTLSEYHRVVDNMSSLPSIINEVSKLMNIRGYTEDAEGFAFAPDALRIEVTGLIGLHLSVVDLPGLISVASEEQSEADIDAVHDMVTTYLQSSRTIILAVLQASNDMANQAIIKLARKHDPQGQRTVGIITKADLINEGAEARIALAAKNQDTIKLKLGFFLLKNPTPSELKEGISMESRSRREIQFFSAPSWKCQDLDQDRIGADKLRVFLQNLLDTHIERELPKVRADIKKTLDAREAQLRVLGCARPTVGHIRSFITSLSMKFYQLFQAALDGSYNSVDVEFFSQHEHCRLRARTQERNTIFANDMRVHGQRRKIGATPTPTGSDDESAEEVTQLIVSETEMMQWVKEAYIRTRGRELPGNFNSALLSELYREQSQRWHPMARNHVGDILSILSQCVDQAVQALVPEDNVRAEIDLLLRQWLERAERLALAELDKLMEDERRSPLTYNHYYTDNVQKERLKGQKAAVRSAIALVTQNDRQGKLHVSNIAEDIDSFVSAVESKITVDMDEQACKEALIQLDAYYKVARKTFVDNVARQVIERHIMAPLPQAFCPDLVAGLSDKELLRIGSEPDDQTIRRSTLSNEAEHLRKCLHDLRRAP